jgi:23S rRNA pseudouridine1911/1915/1917 synthase
VSDGERLTVVVPAESAGMRLDRFLATAEPVVTRSRAKQLIDAGRVRVDGEPRKSSHPLRAGARVDVTLPAPVASAVVAEPLPLVVLYEDPHLLALDKPPGMAVHPAPGTPGGTVVNALLHRLGSLAGVGPAERPGIVHRLDKDTSGVLLVARTPQAHAALARQFRERTIVKRYLAVVRGRMRGEAGLIDRPIGRHPHERKRMSVVTRRGRSAVTRWTVLERFAAATYLRLEPETGRTHQLRVHLAAAGHPILGDALYGVRRLRGSAAACFPRQALHAASLRFLHPVTRAPLDIESRLPEDIERLLAALRQGGGMATKSPRSA